MIAGGSSSCELEMFIAFFGAGTTGNCGLCFGAALLLDACCTSRLVELYIEGFTFVVVVTSLWSCSDMSCCNLSSSEPWELASRYWAALPFRVEFGTDCCRFLTKSDSWLAFSACDDMLCCSCLLWRLAAALRATYSGWFMPGLAIIDGGNACSSWGCHCCCCNIEYSPSPTLFRALLDTRGIIPLFSASLSRLGCCIVVASCLRGCCFQYYVHELRLHIVGTNMANFKLKEKQYRVGVQ